MNRHYVPNYTGSPSWQANDFFNAHSRTLGLSRDRFPHSWFGELWAAIRSILRIGGSHIEEAQLAHSKYYYQGYFEPPYSTRELAAAAGYQAFLIWENHHTILMPSFVPAMKEVMEWISGIAIAESCKLCEELAFTNEKDIREACEWAAKTSQKCYEETHSRIKRFRRHSVGNQRRHQEYYNSKYLPGQSDTMYGGYPGYDDYGVQYGYEQPYMSDGYYGNGFMPMSHYPSHSNYGYMPPMGMGSHMGGMGGMGGTGSMGGMGGMGGMGSMGSMASMGPPPMGPMTNMPAMPMMPHSSSMHMPYSHPYPF